VLARDFELFALLPDLAEQARILDRQHGLSPEGLQEIDCLLGELTRLIAPNNERADSGAVWADQRNDQECAVAGTQGRQTSNIRDVRIQS
jgi:hypothetical protein